MKIKRVYENLDKKCVNYRNFLSEDTVKTKSGKWVNKGNTGKTHGEFKTKKAADAQRKAMFANGYTESIDSPLVYDWYKKQSPDDYQLDYIRKDVTFKDVYDAIKSGKDAEDVVIDFSKEDAWVDSDPIEKIINRSCDLYENKKLEEDIENEEVLPGPKEGPEFGISSLLNEAIQDELKTIDMYNQLALVAKQEGFESIASVIEDINNEETNHVGMLQETLKALSPNIEKIEDGVIEAQEILDNE